jgi:cell shape-determining protein MreC
MSFKFNQVFVSLLLLSVLSAFVLPPHLTNRLRGFGALFAPVSRPTRAIASSIHNRVASKPHRDTRETTDVKDENERLRVLVMSLSGQLEELRRINADRQNLGNVEPLCTPFKVTGIDPGQRDSLGIAASSRDHVTDNMPVLSGRGIVGTIERVGPAGAQVKLISDRDFKASARFIRLKTDDKGATTAQPLAATTPLVRGAGKGALQIANVLLKETALGEGADKGEITAGDYVVLDDPAWPVNLKGIYIGQIESIEQQTGAPQHAMIRVRPFLDFSSLNEVWVLNKLDANTTAGTQ